jgi:uncharacterized membrane protein YjgN (DUF898 family)
MKTVLVVLLIAVALLVLAMWILREVLYFSVVVPNIPGRGVRFWLNALLGGTEARDVECYITSLPPEHRNRWPNWYIAYSKYLMVLAFVVWCIILVLAK